MKILITGANGFLGYYLVKQLLLTDFDILASSKGECRLPFEDEKKFKYVSMDFTDPFEVHDVFEKYQPEIVIHAGAMSKPDECEENQWQCYITNVEGTLNLLMNAEEYKSYFLFLSTDFVFDGETGMYAENDKPAPVNFYGKTKLEGEEAVMAYSADWLIVRTVLVYGKPITGRQNILSIVKQKLEDEEEYFVVNDQVRTPTYVEDLVDAIILLVKKKEKGIFHISGDEKLTPYEMARQTADYLKRNKNLIKPVATSDFQQSAKRPLKTGFNIEKARKEINYSPVSFEDGLKRTFDDSKY